MWVFLALQLLPILLIVLYSTEHTGPTAAQMAQYCGNGPDSVRALYHSYADCVRSYGSDLNGAGHAGQAVGIGLVIFLWVAMDVILGIGRLVVVFARRRRSEALTH